MFTSAWNTCLSFLDVFSIVFNNRRVKPNIVIYNSHSVSTVMFCCCLNSSKSQ